MQKILSFETTDPFLISETLKETEYIRHDINLDISGLHFPVVIGC